MQSFDAYFIALIVYTILQRLSEIVISLRNQRKMLQRGAVEFGASHYPLMVLMHVAFFVCMIVEYLYATTPEFYPGLLILFAIAQAIRFWTIKALGIRWTTRVLVIEGESLVTSGPYRYLSHPNYLVVALEILVVPLAFGLWITAFVFTMLNAAMLLLIRIPTERRALDWSQQKLDKASLNPN